MLTSAIKKIKYRNYLLKTTIFTFKKLNIFPSKNKKAQCIIFTTSQYKIFILVSLINASEEGHMVVWAPAWTKFLNVFS